MYDLKLGASEKAGYLEAARLAGYWLANSQNTPERPWGGYHVSESADRGRFIEKCCPSRDYVKPAGIWLTGIYLCSLCDLKKAPVLDKQIYLKAITEGAGFLKSLQCFDVRWERAIGGFHEICPGHQYSAPRDAATGAYALIALYLETGEEEYLDRAVRFATWYSTCGSDPEGFPWDDYDLEKGEGVSNKRGDWQAGGALVYYQLLKVTGDQQWKVPLKRVLDVLEGICADGNKGDTAYDFHGDCTISVGNDDFASILLLAGYEVFREERYLELFARRLRTELERQDERGAFPNFGGTFVTALELLEALDCSAAWGVEILPEGEVVGPLLKAARFGLSLQVQDNPSRYMLGGVCGQGNYAHNRDVVHGRDAAYALQLWLRLAGHRASAYTVLDWGPHG